MITTNMIQIRHGVFETNSSSTHSMVVCSEEDYQKWVDGELLYDYGSLVKREELDQEYLEDYKTYDQFMDSDYEEVGETIHTTPNGEKVHIVYKYGHD